MYTWIDKVGASNRFDKLTTFWRKFSFPRSSLTNMDLTSSIKHIKYSGELGALSFRRASICNDQQAKSRSWIFPLLKISGLHSLAILKCLIYGCSKQKDHGQIRNITTTLRSIAGPILPKNFQIWNTSFWLSFVKF